MFVDPPARLKATGGEKGHEMAVAGMNPDEMERVAHELARIADEMERSVAQVGARVTSAPWEGSDARRFKDQWWPEHRGNVVEVARGIRALAAAAMNEASQQRSVSGW